MKSTIHVFTTMFRWGIKGGTAILDQGLFSGSNFILNLLMARWLLPKEYGSFSVALAIFLSITAFYIALILEPASVIGPGRYNSVLGSYMTSLYKIHFILTLGASAALVLAAGMMHFLADDGLLLGQALLANGLSLPFVLLIWLVRRIYYVFNKPQYALIGSGLYAILLTLSLGLLHRIGVITLLSAFIMNAIASLASSVIAFYAGRHLYKDSDGHNLSWRITLREQWQYGRWRTGASVLAITFGQIQTFFTAGILGLDTAGILKALQNFVQPMVQVETAIESLALSSVAREYSQGHIQTVKKKSFFISSSLFLLALLYMFLLIRYSGFLDTLIYSGRYSAHIYLAYWLALIPVFLSLAMGFTVPLLAMEKPQYYTVVYVINAPISLIATPLLLKSYGMVGAIGSLILPSVINALVSSILYIMWLPKGDIHG